MSPLVQPPFTGYPDEQRLSNYDSGVLWAENTGLTNVQVISPVLNMSRYENLGGLFTCVQGICDVELEWFLDAAATISTGAVEFEMSNSMGHSLQPRIPNLGPYLKVVVNPIAAGNYQFEANVIATNRTHPLQCVPIQALTLDQQATNIGANASLFINPFDYYAGPLSVTVEMGTAGSVFQFQALDNSGNWDIFAIVEPTINIFTPVVITTPLGAWRVEVFNQAAGATTFYLIGVPSATGAT